MGKLAKWQVVAHRPVVVGSKWLRNIRSSNECGLQVHDDFYR